MTLTMLTAVAAMAALLLWNEWRVAGRPRLGRTAAAIAVAASLTVLAWQPQRRAATLEQVTIDTEADHERDVAAVEAVAARLSPRATVTIVGDGLDPDALELLSGHHLRWNRPARRIGMESLSWPRRAVVGERVTITANLDVAGDTWAFLDHPDGRRDSIRTRGPARFVVVPRAAGAWSWIVTAMGRADTIGIDVIDPAGPRAILVEGRPTGEGASLAARLVESGGGLLQLTRLTATDIRVVRHGRAPSGRTVTRANLDESDVIIFGPGGIAMLDAAARDHVLGAARAGLGVVHLVDSATGTSAIQPFAVRPAPVGDRVRVRIDSLLVAATAIPVAPVTITGGAVILRGTSGEALAWLSQSPAGVFAATRVTAPSRLALAGEPDVETAWWAAILGATLRPRRAEWRVADAALARVDHPLIVERIGAASDSVLLQEGGGAAAAVAMPPTADSLRRRIVLWPTTAGRLSLIDGPDTLRLLIGARDAYPTLDRGSRRRAMQVAIDRPIGRAAPVPQGLLEDQQLWWAWLVLVAGLGVLWTDRR